MTASLKSKLPLVLLCVWCLALLAVRFVYSGSNLYGFMVWNLFLAVVPVVAAALLRALSSRRAGVLLALVLGAVWLAFLPNAPYLVTDLVHLQARAPVPLWYDIIVLGSFAGTGMVLAYVSVADVEAAVRARAGSVWAAIVAYGALVLSGFGIYAGRFLRWNSWDILTSPIALLGEVAGRVADPLSHSRTWVVTALYATALVLGYAALKSAAGSMAADAERR